MPPPKSAAGARASAPRADGAQESGVLTPAGWNSGGGRGAGGGEGRGSRDSARERNTSAQKEKSASPKSQTSGRESTLDRVTVPQRGGGKKAEDRKEGERKTNGGEMQVKQEVEGKK